MNELSSASTIAPLQQRFAIPGVVQIVAGNGGLSKIQISTASARAEIYLHGAQVTSWQPSGAEEVLFVSRHSRWEEGRAIRGGVPICFPWFRAKRDDMKAPAHGLVRTRAWSLEAIAEHDDAVVVTLATASDEASRRWWPHSFSIEQRITVGAELKLELTVTNTGTQADQPMRFEEALHTYYAVGDAARVRVQGLDATAYLDNLDGNREKPQQGNVIFERPTDNAYLHTAADLSLLDPVRRRRILTKKSNSLSTVVWNPWSEGAEALVDLGETEWQQMACVEAANILDNAIALAAGKQHTMTAILSLFPDKS